jgi:hypothetical protein
MIEINNTIELKTNTETERLSFVARYWVQLNFTFDLTVLSNGFSGTSHFCIRRDQIEKVCADLNNMHLTLSGQTVLNDNDSDGFLKFEIESTGRLDVSGQIGGTREDHSVRFRFQTDQTCIPPLIQDFTSLLKLVI